MDQRFYQRILQNYDFFFQENLIYLKSKISPKFHNLLFLSYFFSIFDIFFFLFHLSKLVQKLFNFLQCFIGRIRNFINEFWKFLKVLLKQYYICEIFFVLKFLALVFCFFFIFLLFLTFSFLFHLSVLVVKFWKFFCSFILWIRDFIKEFQKILEHFSKNNDRHLKSIILINSFGYYFVLFILLAFLTSFFSFSPIKSWKRILKIFVLLYYTEYRFYQRILKNS